jgi:hypothetical protein
MCVCLTAPIDNLLRKCLRANSSSSWTVVLDNSFAVHSNSEPCHFVILLFRLQELIPELTAAVEKVGFKWSDFTVTDNSCKPHPPAKSLVQVSQGAHSMLVLLAVHLPSWHVCVVHLPLPDVC